MSVQSIKILDSSNKDITDTILTLNVNESVSLLTSVTPENATNATVTWESEKPDIVQVENGTIKALKAGSAIIKAKAGDKTASITVNVNAPKSHMKISGIPEGTARIYPGDVLNLDLSENLPENWQSGDVESSIESVTWSCTSEAVTIDGAKATVKNVTEPDTLIQAKITYTNGDTETVSHGISVYAPEITLDTSAWGDIYPNMTRTLSSSIGVSDQSKFSCSYSVESGDAEIDTAKSIITFLSAGNVKIKTRYQLENGSYDEALCKTIEVKQPIEIDAITISDKTNKIYDGTTNIPKNSTFSITEIKSGENSIAADELKKLIDNLKIVTDNARFESKDASATPVNIQGVTIEWKIGADSDIQCKYKLKGNTAINVTGNIERREVSAGTLPSAEMTYGKYNSGDLKSTFSFVNGSGVEYNEKKRVFQLTDDKVKEWLISALQKESTISEETAKATAAADLEKMKMNSNGMVITDLFSLSFPSEINASTVVATYEKQIGLNNYDYNYNETGVDFGNNYTLKYEKGSVEVKTQNNFRLGALVPKEDLYQETANSNVFWIKTNGIVKFDIRDDADENWTNIFGVNKGYDQICAEELSGINFASEDGISVNNILGSDSTEKTLNIYLANSASSDTKTNAVEIILKKDTDAPVVTFDENTGANPAADGSNLTYNVFKQNSTNVTFQVSENGSGIQEVKYQIVPMTEDQTLSALRSSLAADGWSEVQGTGTTVTVPGSNVEGYYILAVYVMDNAGNEQIYASNGIVLDLNKPEITNIKQDGTKIKDSNAFFTGDVTTEFNVSDPVNKNGKEVLTSGLKSVDVWYTVERKDGAVEHLFTASPSTNLEISDMTKFGAPKTLKDTLSTTDLTKYASDLPDLPEYGSNNIVLHIKATDMSGRSEETEKEFMVDLKDPEVKVTYDKQPNNGNYYQDPVNAEVTFKERNFVKDGVTVFLKVYNPENGAVKEVTVTGKENGTFGGEYANYGISVSWGADSDAEVTDYKQLSKNRTNVLNLSFGVNGAEYGYEIVDIVCTDAAGRNNKNDKGQGIVSYDNCPKSFVIDHTEPVPEIKIETDATESGIFNTDVVLSVTAADPIVNGSFSGLKSVSYIVKNGDEQTQQGKFKVPEKSVLIDNGIQNLPKDSPWTITVENDSNDITVVVTAEDYAGNTKTVTQTLMIDKTAPVIKVDVTGDDDKDNDQYFYNQRKATVTFTERNFDRSRVKISAYINQAGKKLEISAEELVNDGWKDYGITAAWSPAEDPCEGDTEKEQRAYEKDRKDTLIITFGAECGISNLNVSCTDKAEHTVTTKSEDFTGVSPQSFIIDRTVPVVSVTPVTKPTADGIYNTDVMMQIEAEDPVRNNSCSGLKTVFYEVYKDGTLEEKCSGSFTKAEGTQKAEDTITIPKDLNSNHIEVKVWAVDYTGNKFTADVYPLKLDITKPTVSYTINQKAVNGRYFTKERKAVVTFTERNFDRNKVTVMLGVSPERTGAEKEEDYRTEQIPVKSYTASELVAGKLSAYGVTAKWTKDTEETKSAVNYTDKRENVLEITFGLSGKELYQCEYTGFTVSCVDQADWESGEATASGDAPASFVIDKTAPETTLTVKTDPSSAGIFNKDVVVNISVKDPASENKSWSGLDSVWYTVTSSGKETQKGEFKTEQTQDGNYLLKENNQTLSKDITISAKRNDTNKVVLLVYAKDKAGNESVVAKKELMIDYTNPKINVSVDRTALNKRYFQSYRTATVTFTERNFDKNNVTVKIKASSGKADLSTSFTAEELVNGAMKAHGITASWGTDSDKGSSASKYAKDRTNTLIIVFGRKSNVLYECEYTGFAVSCVDKSGRKSETTVYTGDAPQSFVIDKTNPVPQLSITTSKPAQNIYNRDVSVGVNVTDPIRNNSYSGLKSVTYQVLNGSTVTQTGSLPIANKQKMSGNITVDSGKNDSNDVTVKLFTEDYSGNKAQTEQKMSIDITKPVITVTYNLNTPKNGRYYNAVRTATVVVKERNFDPNGIQWSITNTDGHQPTISGWSHGAANGDNTEHRCTVTFSKDGDYKVTLSATDKAGNKSTYSRVDEFTIDRTAPVVRVTYTNDGKSVVPGTSLGSQIYKQGSITMHVSITEHNFQAGKDVMWTSNGRSIAGSFSSAGDVRTASTVFRTDGPYITAFAYTDLAGNKANVVSSGYFTVDNTAPTGGTVKISPFDAADKFTDFRNFSKSASLTATITGEDRYSGPPEISWYKSANVMTAAQLAGASWTAGSTVTIRSEEQFIIYARLRDKAGNTSYVSSDGVILDRSAGKPEISITTVKPSHDIFNRDVAVNIKVDEPLKNNSYSGIKTVRYEILNHGRVTQSGSFAGSKHQQSMNQNITIDSTKNNSNKVTVKVSVEDQAGNTESAEQEVEIDVTKPKISVEYDPENSESVYYKDIRTATVTIRERNFDPNGVIFDIHNTDGEEPQISAWTHSADNGVSDDTVHTCQVVFAADGDYTFTLSAKDLAGNEAQYDRIDEFTIDRTAPVVKVTYDNETAENVNYFANPRTATITITEHNFDKDAVVFDYDSGEDMGKPVFTDDGDTHTAILNFRNDGYYEIVVSATDLAGNSSEKFQKQTFYIDTVKPEIKISGVEKANKGKVMPKIKVTDNNFDPEGVEITRIGLSHKKDVNVEIEERKDTATGTEITLKDVEKKRDLDDLYTLTVTITDKAGNVQTVEEEYSVNRFGSVYDFDEYTDGLIEQYYNQMPADGKEDVIIYEYNVDTLDPDKTRIQLSLNGDLKELVKDENYTLESESDGNRKMTTYRISRANFAEDGLYTVTIFSVDAAENESTNQGNLRVPGTDEEELKSSTVEFVVDNTLPSVVVTGIEDKTAYNEVSRTMTIDVKDNILLDSLEIQTFTKEGNENVLNEANCHTFTMEELQENSGVMSVELSEHSGTQYIHIIARDKAGNQLGCSYNEDVPEDEALTAGTIYTLSITSNKFEYLISILMMNKPLLYGIIAAVAAAALAIIFFIRRRKMKAKTA